MESKKLIGIVTGLVVLIVVVGAFLVPVVNDATDHAEKFTNTNIKCRISTAESSDTATMTFDGTNLTVNGYVVKLTSTYTYVTADTFVLRVSASGKTWSDRVDDKIGTNWNVNMTTCNLTFSNGHVTGTVNDQPFNHDYGWVILPSADGDLGLTFTTQKYLRYDTEVMTVGMSNIGGENRWCTLSGSIKDGVNLHVVTSTGAEMGTFAATGTWTKVDGYNDLYTMTAFTFDVNGEEVTYNRFIVPYEITAEKTHNEAADSLLNVIPLLIVVSILMFAVSAIIMRNRD